MQSAKRTHGFNLRMAWSRGWKNKNGCSCHVEGVAGGRAAVSERETETRPKREEWTAHDKMLNGTLKDGR
jgi:hypothetical protein